MKILSTPLIAAFVTVFLSTVTARAQDPFTLGWALDAENSYLNFVTVKNGTVMETSSFATLEGRIDQNGNATLDVLLNSIDTSVALWNVRMRFLMFETYTYPKATVTAELTRDMLNGLASARSKTIDLPIKLDLHGVKMDMVAAVRIQLADNDTVTVATANPIVLSVADFNLMGGLKELQETAEVTIVPSTAVNFGLNFQRNSVTGAALIARASSPTMLDGENLGTFNTKECEARFKTLSRTGNIQFQANSATLESGSATLLSNLADFIYKCPDILIEVAGHTDSRGDADDNMTLSKQRAQSVVAYLTSLGLSGETLISRGFGETQPIADNETPLGRSKNRRIEFNILSSGQNN